jgi:hypothetical protein
VAIVTVKPFVAAAPNAIDIDPLTTLFAISVGELIVIASGACVPSVLLIGVTVVDASLKANDIVCEFPAAEQPTRVNEPHVDVPEAHVRVAAAVPPEQGVGILIVIVSAGEIIDDNPTLTMRDIAVPIFVGKGMTSVVTERIVCIERGDAP